MFCFPIVCIALLTLLHRLYFYTLFSELCSLSLRYCYVMVLPLLHLLTRCRCFDSFVEFTNVYFHIVHLILLSAAAVIILDVYVKAVSYKSW